MKLPNFKALAHKIKPLFHKDFYTRENLLHLLKKYKKKLLYIVFGIILILALIPPATLLYFAHDLSNKEYLMNRQKTGLTLLDQDGEEFFSFDKPKDVIYVKLDQIPVAAQQAVISAEDKNFYTNPGVSLRGIARAFLVNITQGEITQGGSTITQELVKNALLNSSRNYLRKYQEIFLAYEVNRRYSKQDILEMYLNSVYFGEGAFGIENAAQAYFGIPASQLTLAQSAMLIGLLPAPSAYSPLSNDPEKAIKRQHIVLDEMVEDNYITEADAEAAKQQELTYNPAPPAEQTNTLAPHFALFVKEQLVKKYGEERVIRDGFKVKTTLNSKWQAYAERIVKNQIAYLRYNKASNGTAIAMDPKTGNIQVMVGSYDWSDEQFGKANMTIAPRQPGSSFKPIVYAEGIKEHVITAATVLEDKAKTFGSYKPQNYDRRFRGPVTVRRALANSLNIPAVEIMERVGVSSGLSMAKRLGITTLGSDASHYGLSLVLGSGEVPLLQMTTAYAVFANKGAYNEPNTILEIHDKYGKEIKHQTSRPKQVILDDVAFIISSILSDNSARAEAFGGALTISRPAAVKTGTTDDYRDALTIGYTPSLVVGVWVGNNDNTPMDNIAGSLGAAPIWRSLMEHFLIGTRIEPFIKPGSIVVRKVCPNKNPKDKAAQASAYPEYFLRGTEPSEECAAPSATPKPSPSNSPQPSATHEPTLTDEPTPTEEPTPTDIPLPTISGATLVPLPTL